MSFDPQPELKGTLLELRPLRADDHDALYAAASDPLIWEQHPERDRHEPAVFRRYFAEQLASGGTPLVLDAQSGEAIGLSRYCAATTPGGAKSRSAGRSRAAVLGGTHNRELKELILGHAFRFVDSVVFLIAPENARSRRAVEKIGAVEIGERLGADGRPSVANRIEGKSWGASAGPLPEP